LVGVGLGWVGVVWGGGGGGWVCCFVFFCGGGWGGVGWGGGWGVCCVDPFSPWTLKERVLFDRRPRAHTLVSAIRFCGSPGARGG